MDQAPAFLGVEKSLTGRRWIGPSVEQERLAATIAQRCELAAPVAQVLARLQVQPEDVAAYLNPSLRDLLPNPNLFKDMEQASTRFVRAVQNSEKIAIFADYDVDGGSSAALLIDWLRFFGLPATLYIPDRIEEGYGPNAPAMDALSEAHNLIICVDCGTLSHEAIAAAKKADVIVLDHHLGGETLPPALAVVNPNRQDETGDFAHLCAAAVVFLFLVASNAELRKSGKTTPDLLRALDLVGLATVADVAPLTGVNRAFVRQGLKIMGNRSRLGLRVLADTAKIDTAPKAYHLGFVLGPRINAGGRIGAANLGARLLATDNEQEAVELAVRLEHLNAERRAIEAEVREEAIAQAEMRGLDTPLAWAAGDGWHAGVVGIVASRLKETANRPAIVIGFEGDEGKGSGRSVSGIDLGASIQRLASEGLITRGGGHKMAAGLSLTKDQLATAMERLSELLAKQGAGDIGPADLKLDGALMAAGASVELIEELEDAGPFGVGAPGPRFAIPSARISFAKSVGDGHLKLTISDAAGQKCDAIAFRAFESEMGKALSDPQSKPVHLAGRFEINEWQGRRNVQLNLEDAAFAEN